jgi:hypothetical protein
MLAAIDDAMAFFLGQAIDFGEQRPVQRRRAIGEQVNEHRTARGDFARLKRARALVAFQIEKLKPVREGHSDLIVMRKNILDCRKTRTEDRSLRSRLGKQLILRVADSEP